jgi:glycosyltransferase involved in cell wall biosynthesis
MKISIIIPVFNEEENLPILIEKIKEATGRYKIETETIFVNDGSTDGSGAVLRSMAGKDKRIKVINFWRNYGQTAALSAGIKFSSGEIIVLMDADLQNDPEDIWPMVQKLNEGYDVISGWRQERWNDKILTRKIPSYLANKLISLVTGVKLNDYGCTLKVYRRGVLQDINLYGEMHRFIPAYAKQLGARIAEMPVCHHPRKFGKTKYGMGRTFRVLLDLLVVKFLNQYLNRPIHFFGGIGFLSFLLGVICFGYATFLKFFRDTSLIQTPLPLLSVFLCLVSVQLILMGLLAEMTMRSYYESRDKPIYNIKEKINF